MLFANEPLFIVVDLFCGAGGTTTGFDLAELENKGIAKVIACVNHDPKAIKSHWRVIGIQSLNITFQVIGKSA